MNNVKFSKLMKQHHKTYVISMILRILLM